MASMHTELASVHIELWTHIALLYFDFQAFFWWEGQLLILIIPWFIFEYVWFNDFLQVSENKTETFSVNKFNLLNENKKWINPFFKMVLGQKVVLL